MCAYLHIKVREDGLKKIYASLKSERVTSYIKLKNISIDLNMAVVLQKEIRLEKRAECQIAQEEGPGGG